MSQHERSTLNCYDQLAELSEEMLSAARQNNWDGLSALELKAQLVVNNLKAMPEESSHNDRFRQEKMRLIRLILALDAQIRDLVQPRLAQLDRAMRAPRTQRRLSAAYGCGRFD
jgi:flagellar protein FliT